MPADALWCVRSGTISRVQLGRTAAVLKTVIALPALLLAIAVATPSFAPNRAPSNVAPGNTIASTNHARTFVAAWNDRRMRLIFLPFSFVPFSFPLDFLRNRTGVYALAMR